MLKNKNETRLYTQILCQSKYSKLPYKVINLYKFGLSNSDQVPSLKGVIWHTYVNSKKVTSGEQIFSHFLLTWFNKQSFDPSWYNPGNSWKLGTTNSYFYLLRYKFFSYINIYPFVPVPKWLEFNPRQTALFPWENTFIMDDLPLPFEDYFTLEGHKYRIGYNIKLNLNNFLPAWYSKVFSLRAQHYPVVYKKKMMQPLYSLSFKPLKDKFLFDEVGIARNVTDARKKRIADLFKFLFSTVKKQEIITEFSIYYRILEQMRMTFEESPTAVYFQDKVRGLKSKKTVIKPYERPKLKQINI